MIQAYPAGAPLLSPATVTGTGGGIPLEPTGSSRNPASNGTRGLLLTRTLSLGSRGTDVSQLQTLLITQGYLIPLEPTGSPNPASNGTSLVTGYFGKLTRAAIQKYQCAKGIICQGTEATTGYGMVGRRTRASLNGGVNIPTPATSGGASPNPATPSPLKTTPPSPKAPTSLQPPSPTILERIDSLLNIFRLGK